ncbi:MAG: histidine phosphatase family protein [Patescibacteria group bacterium]
MSIESSVNKIELSSNPEKFGRNVNINAIFLRHGEKVLSTSSSHTGLAEEGVEMAIDFGKQLTKKDVIKPYSSDTERTIDTVILAIDESPTEKKLSLAIKDDLKPEYDEKGTFMTSVLALKKQILGPDFDSLQPEERKRRLDDYYTQQQDLYLSYDDKRPDSKT